ncbi:MAG: hypothetical protein SGPRY_011989, partial [Prymnesium sp.]
MAPGDESIPSQVPRLDKLCLAAFIRNWHPSRTIETPEHGPLAPELSKRIWDALKAERSRQGEPVRCTTMYPFVRSIWRIDTLDLSDCGKWINDSSLAALQFVTTLRNVRLTACRFISDAGLSFIPSIQLDTLDVSWTTISDSAVSSHISRCQSLTSLNFTGNDGITDQGIASLLCLTKLRKLALCATGITDAGLDYLTYYTRYPDTQKGVNGVDDLRWLELSNTRYAAMRTYTRLRRERKGCVAWHLSWPRVAPLRAFFTGTCRISDTGVGKLVAVLDEEGKPYGK